MERNFYDDEFEDFLKEKADQYSLYPSDRAWYGIFTSLHAKRRLYTAAGAFILIATLFFISLEIVSSGYQKAASNIVNDSISSSRSVTTASTAAEKRRNLANKQQAVLIADNRPSSSGDNNNTTIPYNLPGSAPVSDNTNNNTSPVVPSRYRAVNNAVPAAFPDLYPIKNTTVQYPVLIASAGPLPVSNAFIDIADSDADMVPVQNGGDEKQMKEHSVNWLRERAAIKLSPNKKNYKFYHLQFYVSPGAGYRRLRTDNSSGKNRSLTPPASGAAVNIDGIVDHHPSFGFEAGTAILLSVSDRFVLKAGLQLNYVRYNINAYKSSRERTAITLSRTDFSNIHDTITSYSSIRNLGGRYPQQLQNQYVQISLPIGAEVRVLGNKRFQFNISGTLQPSYLLYNNSYLLTSDYANYIKQPGLVRKWNVNAAIEPYISYSTGALRWQLGPQFRYQLLSSYTDRYPVREYLMEYGIKVGVSKTIR